MSDSTIETPTGGRDAPAAKPVTHWLAPVMVALIGAFMSILDSSIVNVAIPTIMNVFNAATSDVQWVSTIYMLAMGVVVPLSGWLGDKIGYKRLYMATLAIFVMGSLLCGISWDLNSLIFFRVLQAIGGGMIMPTMMAMIYSIVPRDKIGSGMAIFGISLMVGPALGPTIGGYLVEYVNWRWIFTINLPIGIVGILLAWIVLPDFPSKKAGKLDVGGALSSAVMLFSLLLALSKGSDWGWTDERIIILFAISFFTLLLFVYLELTSDNPLLELRVFKYRSFTTANLLVVITTIGMYAAIFYLPLFLQRIRGLGAMETGLLLMPGALASGLMMPITGKLYDKIGPRPLAIFGVIGLGLVMFQFHKLDVMTANSTIVWWATLRGMVMAFANMPAQTAALSDVPNNLIGRASAISNIIRSVSGSFGLAVLTAILTARQAFHGARLTWTLVPSNPVVAGAVARISGVLGGGSRGQIGALAYLNGIVARNSFINGIDDVFVVAAMISFVALIPAIFLVHRKFTPSGAPRAPLAE